MTLFDILQKVQITPPSTIKLLKKGKKEKYLLLNQATPHDGRNFKLEIEPYFFFWVKEIEPYLEMKI